MQQAEEPAAEAESERVAGLRLVHQRRIVQPELVQCVAQVRVVVAVHRVQAGEHHRLGMVVAGQRLARRVSRAGHGVADPGLADVLDPADQVADLAGGQALGRLRLRRDDAHLERLVRRAGGHHQGPLAPGEPAVHDPDVGDHAAVGVVHRVEDQRTGLGVRVTSRGRDETDDLVQQVLDALARLGADPQDLGRIAADDAGQLGRVAVGLRGGQVDLVQHRDDLQVAGQSQVQVGQRLRLDALRGVHQQDRPLARGQAAGDLIGEVHMARGVDEVEHVLLVVAGPGQPDGLALDRDAALALDVHPVQVLRTHLASLHHAGELKHPVGQRRLAVIDVRDDAEVPDHGLVGVTGGGAGR